MRICVIGTGYVGLVAAACFAKMGHDVVGVDADERKMRLLRDGISPIHEPGLDELLTRHLGARLAFASALDDQLSADLVFLAVGTREAADGSTDLRDLRRAAVEVAKRLPDGAVVVNKSTAPVGTGEALRALVAANRPPDARFHMAVNPEFLRQGFAVEDFLRPARIVIGAEDEPAAQALSDLYRPLARPIHLTDMRSAELIKYAANAFLAVKISFINSIADLCERTGADVEHVAEAVGADPRIGHGCLRPGLGFGGSCPPKDTVSLLHQARRAGCDAPVVAAARAVNAERPRLMLRRLERLVGGIAGRRIALFGLAFKGGTDDIRESRGMELARMLSDAGAHLRAYDPAATPRARATMPELVCSESPYQAAGRAEAAVIAADWDEFKQLDLRRLRAVMARPLVIDGCNLWALDEAARAGLEYHSVGRQAVSGDERAQSRRPQPTPPLDEAWQAALAPRGA